MTEYLGLDDVIVVYGWMYTRLHAFSVVRQEVTMVWRFRTTWQYVFRLMRKYQHLSYVVNMLVPVRYCTYPFEKP